MTQVVIKLSSTQCNVSATTQKVTLQVGYDVILLDSKCLPILTSEGTSGVEFWRSTHEILAASQSRYEHLTGKAVKIELEGVGIDLTGDDVEPGPEPPTKRPKQDDSASDTALKITRVEKRLNFIDEIATCFNCVICKALASSPVVSSCCHRVVGCETCVLQWVSERSRCPLCSSATTASAVFVLRGFDDVMQVLRAFNPDREAHSTSLPVPAAVQLISHESDDSDFEDLPPFSIARNTSA